MPPITQSLAYDILKLKMLKIYIFYAGKWLNLENHDKSSREFCKSKYLPD